MTVNKVKFVSYVSGFYVSRTEKFRWPLPKIWAQNNITDPTFTQSLLQFLFSCEELDQFYLETANVTMKQFVEHVYGNTQ